MAQKHHRNRKQTQDDKARRPAHAESQNEQVKNPAQAASLIAGRPVLGRQRSVAMRRVNQTQGNRFAQALVKQRQQATIMRSDIGYQGQEKEIIDVTTINSAADYRGGGGGHITFTLQSGRLWTDIDQVFVNGDGVDLAPEDANHGSSETRVAVPAEHFSDIREIVVYFRGSDSAGSGAGGRGSGVGGDGAGSGSTPQIDDSADSGGTAAPRSDEVTDSGSGDGGSGDRNLVDEATDALKMTREDLISHIETRRDELGIPAGSIGQSQFNKASDDGLRVLLRSLNVAEAGNEQQEDIVIEIAQRLVNASNAQETAARESQQTMQRALDILRE